MRPATALALLALVVTAGCTGLGGPATPADTDGGVGSPGDTPLATATAERTADSDAGTDHTATATAAPVPEDATAGNTLAYANLTERQRAAVRRAVDESVRFAPESPSLNDSDPIALDAVDPFQDAAYVRWNGTYYRVELHYGQLIGAYGIEATGVSPPVDGDVVPLSNLSGSARADVREAISTGSYHAPAGRTRPEALRGVEYVSDGDRVYRLRYVIADIPTYDLRLVAVR